MESPGHPSDDVSGTSEPGRMLPPDDQAQQWPDGRPVTPWADPWHDIAGDIASLYILESIIVPLPVMLPSQREEINRIYRESGELTREMIARLLAGEFR
jgi:hypothetical protein